MMAQKASSDSLWPVHLASLCSGCPAGIPSSLVPFVFVVSAGVVLELELDDEEREGAFLFAVFGRCFVGVAALDFGVVCCGFRGLTAPVLRVPEVLACTLASAGEILQDALGLLVGAGFRRRFLKELSCGSALGRAAIEHAVGRLPVMPPVFASCSSAWSQKASRATACAIDYDGLLFAPR